jgi:O-acetyl-ADP-ribose deacetylase (regulator of RNase III)
MKIYLTAVDGPLLQAWRKFCEPLNNADTPFTSTRRELVFVEVAEGSILDLEVEAVVSPANSFGFMDGGIDAAYTRHFGEGVQEALQDAIRGSGGEGGELLVGQALVVPTARQTEAIPRSRSERIPWLIAAPTMRVPMILGRETVNPYLAARAALRLAKHRGIKSIAFPGLGTGVGRVPPEICAQQMRVAIEEVILERVKFPKTWREAQLKHMSLYTASQHDLQHGI